MCICADLISALVPPVALSIRHATMIQLKLVTVGRAPAWAQASVVTCVQRVLKDPAAYMSMYMLWISVGIREPLIV